MADHEPIRKPLNAKQRAFAMLWASGQSQAAAYRSAYGSVNPNETTIRTMAGVLARTPKVRALYNQLQADTALALSKHVVEDLALDRTYVLRNLKEVVERCMDRAPVLDRNGKPVMVETKKGQLAAAYTFDSKGANRALELIGKELAMFIERKEVRHGALAEASDEELDAELGRLASELARVTGKPIKQILMESVRSELAIDITPANDATSHSLAVIEHANATPGGSRELAADGTH